MLIDFDRHFLTHGAVPFLARCLQRDAPADPAELAAVKSPPSR